MRRPRLFLLAIAAATTALATTPRAGGAQTFNSAFGGTGYACLNQMNSASCNAPSGGGPISYLWNNGDYYEQTLTGTGLSSVSSLVLDLSMQNELSPGQSVALDVLLNGTTVGSIGAITGLGPIFDITQPFSATFAPISASSYVVRLLVSSPTLPSGGGALGLYIGGGSTIALANPISTAPEPATFALVASGLGAIVGLARVNRRRA